MSFTAVPAAGAKLRASVLSSLITELRPIYAVKTADEPAIISSTTYQADDHLFLPFSAGITYELAGWIALEGPTAGDIKMRVSWTGTLTRFDWGLSGLATTATTGEGDLKSVAQLGSTTSPSTEIIMGTITANWSNILISGTVVTSTAGQLTLEYAQSASTATNTIVKKGSWMKLIQTS